MLRTILSVLVLAGLFTNASSLPADVLQLEVVEWGPLMPLGKGASGRQLLDVDPAAKLDDHMTTVEIVQTEMRKIRTSVNNEPQELERAYYFFI